MSKKSWVAMTGLCVLMATSAAQAHPISVSAENFEAGAQVGRFDATDRAHTFRALGQQSSVAGLISRSPLRAPKQPFGKNGDSIVDRICDRDPVPPTKVPEPESLALLMAGLLGVAVARRRRRDSATTG